MEHCDYCGASIYYDGLQNRVELPDGDYVILCDACLAGNGFEVTDYADEER